MKRSKKDLEEERQEVIAGFEGSYEQAQFIRGIELFDKYTNNGKKVITNRDIKTLGTEDLECLMLYCATMRDKNIEGSIEEETANKCVSLLADIQGDLLLKTTDWIIKLYEENNVYRP